MQQRRSATAIVAVLFGPLTSFAGENFGKGFSSVAKTSTVTADASFKFTLLSERALQIAEQIFSAQSLVPIEAVVFLQQFAWTYSELASPADLTESIALLKILTANINTRAGDPNQQLRYFQSVNMLVDNIQNVRHLAENRAGAIYLLIRHSTLRETWVADKRFDLIALHDMLKNLIDRIDGNNLVEAAVNR